jgi:hypothetical protein
MFPPFLRHVIQGFRHRGSCPGRILRTARWFVAFEELAVPFLEGALSVVLYEIALVPGQLLAEPRPGKGLWVAPKARPCVEVLLWRWSAGIAEEMLQASYTAL